MMNVEIAHDTWQARWFELLMTSSLLPVVVLNRSASCGGSQTTFSCSVMVFLSLLLLLSNLPSLSSLFLCLITQNPETFTTLGELLTDI